MKYQSIFPLLAILFMFATPLIAQSDNPKQCDSHKGFFEELNLTDEQATQLKLLKLDMQKEHILHFDEVKKVREKIKGEMLKEKPSQSILDGFAKELGKLHGELEKKRFSHFLKIKGALNKEQFEKILSKEFRKDMFRHDKKQGKGKKGF